MPLHYIKRVFKAVIPRRTADVITVSLMVVAIVYPSYKVIFQDMPIVTVYSETQYPRSVPRGGYFFLRFDLEFDRDCNIYARRFIIASDGVAYLAQEDYKNVTGGERIQYTVRVPVSEAMPLGNALFRSQFIYRCDFWARWIKPVERAGQARRVIITPEGTQPTSDAGCILPPREGFTVVRAYYRKKKRDDGAFAGSDIDLSK